MGEIMETQAGLRRGWSLAKYKALGSYKQQLRKDVVAVDECIRDVGHRWSNIKTKEKIYKLLRLLMNGANQVSAIGICIGRMRPPGCRGDGRIAA